MRKISRDLFPPDAPLFVSTRWEPARAKWCSSSRVPVPVLRRKQNRCPWTVPLSGLSIQSIWGPNRSSTPRESRDVLGCTILIHSVFIDCGSIFANTYSVRHSTRRTMQANAETIRSVVQEVLAQLGKAPKPSAPRRDGDLGVFQ